MINYDDQPYLISQLINEVVSKGDRDGYVQLAFKLNIIKSMN